MFHFCELDAAARMRPRAAAAPRASPGSAAGGAGASGGASLLGSPAGSLGTAAAAAAPAAGFLGPGSSTQLSPMHSYAPSWSGAWYAGCAGAVSLVAVSCVVGGESWHCVARMFPESHAGWLAYACHVLPPCRAEQAARPLSCMANPVPAAWQPPPPPPPRPSPQPPQAAAPLAGSITSSRRRRASCTSRCRFMPAATASLTAAAPGSRPPSCRLARGPGPWAAQASCGWPCRCSSGARPRRRHASSGSSWRRRRLTCRVRRQGNATAVREQPGLCVVSSRPAACASAQLT